MKGRGRERNIEQKNNKKRRKGNKRYIDWEEEIKLSLFAVEMISM